MTLQTDKFTKYSKGDRASAYDLNSRADLLRKLATSMPASSTTDGAGLTTRTARKQLMKRHKIFKILSYGNADNDDPGMYGAVAQKNWYLDDDTYKPKYTMEWDNLHIATYLAWATATAYQRLDPVSGTADFVTHNNANGKTAVYRCESDHTSGASTEPETGVDWETVWSTYSSYVWNMMESYPIIAGSGYSPALAAGDLMFCTQMYDQGHQLRWVGLPLSGDSRLAVTTEAADGTNNVNCDLLDATGAAITTGLGSDIDVYGLICPAAVTALNACIPRIVSGDTVKVKNVQGKWYFDFQFQGTTDCDCIDAQANDYTVTNEAVDRTFDADTVAIAELADVVGTLINDLALAGIITTA
jgi:hypothetical protein